MQLFEPVLIHHMLQLANHLGNTAGLIPVCQYCYCTGSSKLALVLKAMSLKCQIEGNNYFPQLAGYSLDTIDKLSKIN